MSVIAQADCIKLPFPSTYFHAIITSPPYLGLRKYEGDQVKTWRSGGYQPMTGADHIKVDRWVGPLGGEPSVELYVFHLILVCREIRRVLRDDGVFWLVLGDSYNGSGGAGGDYLAGGLREGQPTYPGRSFSQLQSGDLIGVPQRIRLALQADGWVVRNDAVWWKRNPMPENLNGWRYERSPCDCTTKRREALIASMPDGVPRHRAASEKPGDIGPSPDCPKCHGTGRVGEHALRKGSWRHTRSHEDVFQLVKKMKYYCNLEAVREIYTEPLNRWGGPRKSTEEAFKGDEDNRMRGLHRDREMRPHSGRNPRSVLDVKLNPVEAFYHWLGERTGIDLHQAIEIFQQEATNPNDVLNVPTTSYRGAHYAVFPPNLIAPLILSSCPRRSCPDCGAPWAPVVERGKPVFGATSWGLGGRRHFDMKIGEMVDTGLDEGSTLKHDVPRIVTGYRPTCSCGYYEPQYRAMIEKHPTRSHNKRKRHQQDMQDRWLDRALSNRYIYQTIDKWLVNIPGRVLDPFLGSGTTMAVAKELLRRGTGVDISFEYLDKQAKLRAGVGTPSDYLDDLPLFSEG